MDIITLTKENLEQEHICCAIASNKDCQMISKKSWLEKRLDEGLMFKKCDVRGKCFIEYIPAEMAWSPVNANDYMYIDCFWIAGQFKGNGYANLLLEECIKDSKAKGKVGLVALSSQKKKPYLSDPGYLKHKGFKVADVSEPFYELLYLPFEESAPVPVFMDSVKTGKIQEKDFVLYYSHQCPYTAKHVPMIQKAAKEANIPLQCILLESATQAKQVPSPFTTFSLFYNGDFITHEMMTDSKFVKLATQLMS